MGTIIIKDAVKREPGFIYYIDGKGNLCRAVMARGRTKSKVAKVAKVKAKAVKKAKAPTKTKAKTKVSKKASK